MSATARKITIGSGTKPKRRDDPNSSTLSGKGIWIEREKSSPTPLPATIVPRVAIKGTILTLVIRNAVTLPKITPTARQMSNPIQTGAFISCIASPATVADTYIVEPTERSMPAVKMTKVIPTATMPM